ncbi:MAG: DUF6273 domain-containing protein [Coriobacteriia bacterium]|nr:DUF6273 domain-containing protein [Coriobacteriia bacterium]
MAHARAMRTGLALVLGTALALGGAAAVSAMQPQLAHAKVTKIHIGSKGYNAKKSFKYGKHVTWSAKRQTLTLKGATSLRSVNFDGSGAPTVRVYGKCTMRKGASVSADKGLRFAGTGSLYLSGSSCSVRGGSGALRFAGPYVSVKGSERVSVMARHVVVSRGKLVVSDHNATAIKADGTKTRPGTFKVTGGSVVVKGKGIRGSNVKVTGGSVRVTSGGSVRAGSWTYKGKRYGGYLYVTGGSLAVAGNLYGDRGSVKCSRLSVGGGTHPYDYRTSRVSFSHSMGKVAATNTCTKAGYKAHYRCGCGLLATDSAGKNVVRDKADLRAKAKGHAYNDEMQGSTVRSKCARCGHVRWTTTAEGRLDGYTWPQLKSMADQIAACPSSSAALEEAKSLGLVRSDGKLRGDETKTIVMRVRTHPDNGYETRAVKVQILGFWHDDKTEGGKAGITFGFKDVVDYRAANPTNTNSGGWRDSEMRSWLNSSFYDSLPSDLSCQIASVYKSTNNVGQTDAPSSVSVTPDRVWQLGMRECYGYLSDASDIVPEHPMVYNAEGTQYQLYSDNGVTMGNPSFLKKCRVGSTSYIWWWLRSPNADLTSYFHRVSIDGSWENGIAVSTRGVSPGFCL